MKIKKTNENLASTKAEKLFGSPLMFHTRMLC